MRGEEESLEHPVGVEEEHQMEEAPQAEVVGQGNQVKEEEVEEEEAQELNPQVFAQVV